VTTQSNGPTRHDAADGGGTRAESDGPQGLDGAGPLGTCAHSDGPTRGLECAIHLGISAENDGPSGDDVADNDGSRTGSDGTFDVPIHVTGLTTSTQNYLGTGSGREGSVDVELPHRIGVIHCIKGKGSGQGHGSGRLVDSRAKGHAAQVAGDRPPTLYQCPVSSIGSCVGEALGCIDSWRRLGSK
jgi:hypothetical protein